MTGVAADELYRARVLSNRDIQGREKMTEKAFSTATAMTNAQIQEWRRRGESEKRVMFLFFSVLLGAITLSVLLLSGTAYPAGLPQQAGPYSGGPRRMRMSPDEQLARFSKELKLTKDQKAKIKPILDDQFQEMARLRQDSSMSWQDRRAKLMDLRKKTMDEIRPILTDKQQAKLQEMEQRQAERMRSWQSRHGAPAVPPGQ
jgi:periplasmic protein CpxP/Spy